MPRALVSLALALLLSSACISVESLEPFWNQATIDRELVGDWTAVESQSAFRPYEGPVAKTLRFTVDGSSLRCEINREAVREPSPPMLARTLTIGQRRLLLLGAGATGGLAVVYDITNGLLRQYWPNLTTTGAFFDARPRSPSIEVQRSMGEALVVRRLDQEAHQILSELSDPKYWILIGSYQREPKSGQPPER